MAKQPGLDFQSAKGGLGELKRRLLFVIGALIVFRIGSFIPIPGIDAAVLAKLLEQQRGTIIEMFNMFSGGALSRASIFALGIMPYISASIIMQLLTVASPQLEALKKEGEGGRRKITQYTRYGTLALALFQGLGIAVALESQQGLVLDPGLMFRFVTVSTLVTGTMFLMWLGEQITERGLGNGISIIIFAGIAAGLPNSLGGLFELVRTGAMHPFTALVICVLVVVVTALSGYHRALAARFTVFNQYRQLWHHAWNQSQLSTNVLPAGWQASRGQTTLAGCVSITVTLISPLGRRGEITRLHCPVSQ